MTDLIEIHEFSNAHLTSAGDIAHALWGDEVPDMPESLRPVIYQYLTRYYYTPHSPFLLGASEAGKLCAFLFATFAQHPESTQPADDWIHTHLSDEEERAIFQEYKAYLDGNREKEFRHAVPSEVILLFFCSARRGAGRLLMTEFEGRCRHHGVSSILLWTDETCDFEYYHHNGFTVVAQYPADPPLFGKAIMTYLFRKNLY